MKFSKLIDRNKFSLVVSLPRNDLTLAEAALKGGAQAIKVHVNVWHRASGQTFGTFAENKKFLGELVRLCGDIPVGLVPGADEAFVSFEELGEIEALGIDFFSSYADHLPIYMLESKKLCRVVAIDSSYTQTILDGINKYPPDVFEISAVPGEAYGQKLNYTDILRYADIDSKVKLPIVIPTQKCIAPNEVHHLFAVGCKAIMIGAIVLGKEPDPATVEKTCAAFAQAVKNL